MEEGRGEEALGFMGNFGLKERTRIATRNQG
jgi:hypothetical protein